MANISRKVYESYLKSGWSVFPVNFYKDSDGKVVKKPAVSWKKYQVEKASEEDLQDWDGKYPGIGLVTGQISHVVVVDVDTPDLSKIPFELYSPIITKSAFSGGKHFYYKWSEELRNTTQIKDLPLDFRGDGGYVVLPPSNFQGKKYEFEKKTHPMFLSQLPADFKKNLSKNIVKQEQKVNYDKSLPEAMEGSRNDTAARVAGSFIQKSPKSMLNMAWLAFQQWNESYCNPPLSQQELRTTWESILQTHQRNNPANSASFKIYNGSEAEKAYQTKKDEWGSGVSTGFRELDDYFTLLPQHIYLLSATTHTGKTTFALNMASRTAMTKNVLFCSLEMGLFITPKVRRMVGEYPQGLKLLSSDDMMTPDQLVQIVESMREKPDVVYIDHIHFFKRTSDNISQEIDQIILQLQNVAKQLDIPIVLIAHTRKLNQDRPPRLDDLRDSSSLAQVPSVVMQLYRKENEEDEMLLGSGYMSKKGMLFVQKNRIGGKTGAIRYELDDRESVVFENQSDFYKSVKEILLER